VSSLIFNGTDLTPYLKIKKISGRGPVKREIYIKEIAGKDGGYYQKKRRPVRVLTIEADIKSQDEFELRDKIDELNGILNVDGPSSIVFPDEPEKEYFGIPEINDDGDEFLYYHKGALIIVCPDPNKYGQSKNVSLSSGLATVAISGNEKVKPTLNVTFTSSASNFSISNGIDTLNIIYDFVATDTLELDFAKKKVKINGIVNMLTIDLNNPIFFDFVPGNNNITINPATTATLTYREAWS
jgi:predicted phage tail component-like protein